MRVRTGRACAPCRWSSCARGSAHRASCAGRSAWHVRREAGRRGAWAALPLCAFGFNLCAQFADLCFEPLQRFGDGLKISETCPRSAPSASRSRCAAPFRARAARLRAPAPRAILPPGDLVARLAGLRDSCIALAALALQLLLGMRRRRCRHRAACCCCCFACSRKPQLLRRQFRGSCGAVRAPSVRPSHCPRLFELGLPAAGARISSAMRSWFDAAGRWRAPVRRRPGWRARWLPSRWRRARSRGTCGQRARLRAIRSALRPHRSAS